MNFLIRPGVRRDAGTIPVQRSRRAVLAFAAAILAAPALAALAVAGPAGAADGASQAQRAAAAPVGAGFIPVAASFQSPASGFVLGGVNCAGTRPCAARLAATTTGGARWHFAGTPHVRLASAVSGVLFADGRDGWLYGQQLWSTHDGGAHWRALSLGVSVVNMAVSAGTVYAVVQQNKTVTSPWVLFRSSVGADAWTRVGTFTSGPRPNVGPGAGLAVSGRAAWFGSNSTLWATADGAHWHKVRFQCPRKGYGLSDMAAASPSDVVFVCIAPGGLGNTFNQVLTSADGGKTVHPAPGVLGGNGAYIVAVPPGRASVISGGGSVSTTVLSRSVDGGKTFQYFTVPASDGGGGTPLNSLSYVNRTVGWVVVGGTYQINGTPVTYGVYTPGALLRTSNAGATWNKVAF